MTEAERIAENALLREALMEIERDGPSHTGTWASNQAHRALAERAQRWPFTEEQKVAVAKAIFDNDYADMRRLKAEGRWLTAAADTSGPTAPACVSCGRLDDDGLVFQTPDGRLWCRRHAGGHNPPAVKKLYRVATCQHELAVDEDNLNSFHCRKCKASMP